MDNQHPSSCEMEKVQRLSLGKGVGVKVNYSEIADVTEIKGDIIIYYLKDPRNQEIRYIGKTTEKDFRKRYISHMFEGRNIKYTSHKSRWIRSVVLSGNELIMEEVDRISYTENWEWLECFWISIFKSWGFMLLNMTTGGEGNQNQKFSKESIKLRNSKLKSKVRTSEQRERVSKGLLGRKLSKIHKHNTREGIIKLQGKAVNQYSLDGNFIQNFRCVIDAAIYLGNRNKQANIHKCCRQDYPKYKTAYGFIWKYSNEDIVQSV